MKVNYHAHTWRCKLAEEDERAYVERAIEGGLSELGFSDHTPYIFPGGYYSCFRMLPDQIDDYVDTVLSLRFTFIFIPVSYRIYDSWSAFFRQ